MAEDHEFRNIRLARPHAAPARDARKIGKSRNAVAHDRRFQFSGKLVEGGPVAGKPCGNERFCRVERHEVGQCRIRSALARPGEELPFERPLTAHARDIGAERKIGARRHDVHAIDQR